MLLQRVLKLLANSGSKTLVWNTPEDWVFWPPLFFKKTWGSEFLFFETQHPPKIWNHAFWTTLPLNWTYVDLCSGKFSKMFLRPKHRGYVVVLSMPEKVIVQPWNSMTAHSFSSCRFLQCYIYMWLLCTPLSPKRSSKVALLFEVMFQFKLWSHTVIPWVMGFLIVGGPIATWLRIGRLQSNAASDSQLPLVRILFKRKCFWLVFRETGNSNSCEVQWKLHPKKRASKQHASNLLFSKTQVWAEAERYGSSLAAVRIQAIHILGCKVWQEQNDPCSSKKTDDRMVGNVENFDKCNFVCKTCPVYTKDKNVFEQFWCHAWSPEDSTRRLINELFEDTCST